MRQPPAIKAIKRVLYFPDVAKGKIAIIVAVAVAIAIEEEAIKEEEEI